MTLREIFSGIIDYDLSPILYFCVGFIFYFFIPIGMLWLGFHMLSDGFAKEQPHDRDLFGRIFLICSGFGCFAIAIFIWWDLIKYFL